MRQGILLVLPLRKKEITNMVSIDCPFCHKQGEEFWQENGFLAKKCMQDEVVFVSPRPDEKELEKFYADDFLKTHGIPLQGNFGKALSALHALKFIRGFKKNGDLLEIGSGSGDFLLKAREAGFNVFGVELGGYPVLQTLQIEIERKSALNEDYFPGRTFDIAYHADVLSHLSDPLKAFRILYDKLNQDGLLIFQTGNFGSISEFWLKFVGGLGLPEHLYLFSPKSVAKLLDATGFQIISESQYSIVLYRFVSRFIKSKHRAVTSEKSDPAQIGKLSILEKIKGWTAYFLVYVAGKLLPKAWPATVIFIARKKTG